MYPRRQQVGFILDSTDRHTISLYNSFITSNDTPQLHTAIRV